MCPDIEQLERYCEGRLDVIDSREFERHVASCAACRVEAEDVRANLALTAPVREALSRQLHVGGLAASGGSIAGYQILGELGRGGMGVVFLAEQDYPRRRVALKVLLPGVSRAGMSERFAREANLLAQLHHPGIAQVYEAGVAEDIRGFAYAGRAYIAMEYVPGETLDQYLVEHRPTLVEKCQLMALVCDAVHHAHVHGVVHRDLKPSNIVVIQPTRQALLGVGIGDDAQPKILDFGVARATDADLHAVTMQTEVGQLIGTAPYMSPEQVTGDPGALDARSDVYALGVIAYEVFCGALPYEIDSRSLPEAIRVIREVEPIPLSRRDASLRGDVELITHKALEKEVSRRYQSAAELASDLRRFLKDEPVSACPPTALYQVRKFTRRNRALVTTAGMVVVSMMVGMVASVWQALKAVEARDLAERRLAVARDSADFVMFGLGNRHAGVLGGTAINRDLMEQVYSYYKRLAEERPEDLVLKSHLWGALGSWAHAVHETGQRDRAESMLMEARGLAASASAADPGSATFRSQLGRIDFSMALVLRDFGALSEARDRMLLALKSFEGAADVFEATPIFENTRPSYDTELEHWRKLAQINRMLGEIALDGWRIEEAERCVQVAMGYCENLRVAAGDSVYYGCRERGLALIEVGRVAIARGAFEAAERALREAVGLLDRALETDRDNPIYAFPLARGRHELARVLVLTGRFEEAAGVAERAVAWWTRLVEADEAHVVYRRGLAESAALLALGASRVGDVGRSDSAAMVAREAGLALSSCENAGPPELLTAARVLLMVEPAGDTGALALIDRGRSLLRHSVGEYDAVAALALVAGGDREKGHQAMAGVVGAAAGENGARHGIGWTGGLWAHLASRVEGGDSRGVDGLDVVRLR